jgi:SAM-dependent methyltransferase
MSGNPRLSKIDVAQLVQDIREQIAQKNGKSVDVAVPPTEEHSRLSSSAQIAADLQSVREEIEEFSSRVEIGEPHPESATLRSRLGALLKSRLSRFLWWQSYQIKSLAILFARQNREQMRVVEALQLRIADTEVWLRESKETVGELQKHVARLEYAKANRSESVELAAHYDSLLANKANREEVSDLARQIKILDTGKAEERDLDAIEERVRDLSVIGERVRDLSVIGERVQDLNAIEERVKECESCRVDPEQIAGQIAGLNNKVQTAAHKITVLRQDLQDFHRRLSTFLEQVRKRMPEPFTPEQIADMALKGEDLMDSLYLAFEDRFRGGFDTIREGLKVYLPHIREALQRAEGGLVLDVACGRGEWLDLLRDEAIQARGVDLNGAAIELCQRQGLDVTREDALAYLQRQPNNSLSALTSFHFIEHIDYRSWIALLDESLRTLKPGGVAIFETPNARNILTTAGDFYRDPTHNRPVFPETIEAIAELRGFFDSKVYSFNENRSELIPLSEHRFDVLEDYVSVSRDVTWVGIKS